MGSKIEARFCTLPPPHPIVKLGQVGQDVQVMVSSSTEDPTCDILVEGLLHVL